jgi:hypothetical protein
VGRDRAVIHYFANYRVKKGLSRLLLDSDVLIDSRERWERVPAPDIRAAAKRLLAAKEQRLLKDDPKGIARFLGE